jgi:CTP-dependent riboflavin kinase
MALDWVQNALTECLNFAPFPATLNVRPVAEDDARAWAAIQNEVPGIALRAAEDGFCSAQLYKIKIYQTANAAGKLNAAILMPHVADYPKDKIEIVAPIRLKTAFGVRDGDQLTLEFVH